MAEPERRVQNPGGDPVSGWVRTAAGGLGHAPKPEADTNLTSDQPSAVLSRGIPVDHEDLADIPSHMVLPEHRDELDKLDAETAAVIAGMIVARDGIKAKVIDRPEPEPEPIDQKLLPRPKLYSKLASAGSVVTAAGATVLASIATGAATVPGVVANLAPITPAVTALGVAMLTPIAVVAATNKFRTWRNGTRREDWAAQHSMGVTMAEGDHRRRVEGFEQTANAVEAECAESRRAFLTGAGYDIRDGQLITPEPTE